MTAFNYRSLTLTEKELFKKFPDSYQAFIKKTNGSLLDESVSYFDVPIEREFNGVVHNDTKNALNELWCFISYEEEEGDYELPSVLHQYYDRHMDEGFLPRNVYVIGRCIQSSLIAVSLNEHDYGSIYYWEWYWQYPWFKDFFQRRIQVVLEKYPNVPELQKDPDSEAFKQLSDDLNYATLVKVGDSFDAFLNSLYKASEDNQ